jgi:predicted N-acetyltransferase YhbS
VSDINIRVMTQKDKSSIMQILRSIPEFKACEVDVAEEVIDAYLSYPCRSGYHVLVAELDSAIAGYMCFGPTPMTEGTWDLYWMAVTPDRQGQGIGNALMESAEGEIKKLAGRLAIIETSSTPAYASWLRNSCSPS